MVTPPRNPAPTVAFIDHYCWIYRSLFDDVRHFECFKYLHLGMLSEIPRKSLPEIALISRIKRWTRTPSLVRLNSEGTSEAAHPLYCPIALVSHQVEKAKITKDIKGVKREKNHRSHG